MTGFSAHEFAALQEQGMTLTDEEGAVVARMITGIPDGIRERARELAASEQIRFACAYGTVITDSRTAEAIARAIMEAEARGEKRERERCAKICDEQSAIFSSDSYAVDQPISSFSERFACAEIKAAILKGEA